MVTLGKNDERNSSDYLMMLHPRRTWRKNLSLATLTLGALLVATCGCSQKKTEAMNAPATPPVDTNVAPANAASNPANGQPATPAVMVDLPGLQRSVIRWVVANRRRPSSFEEFAATADVKIPPPPAGKKYFLPHDLHVQLVNR